MSESFDCPAAPAEVSPLEKLCCTTATISGGRFHSPDCQTPHCQELVVVASYRSRTATRDERAACGRSLPCELHTMAGRSNG